MNPDSIFNLNAGLLPALIGCMDDQRKRFSIGVALNQRRRFHLALREPGWIDNDPPTWLW